MKSKQELKKYFENGDKPTQEQFWEWQESYWHKDEKLKNTIPLSGTEDGENVTGKITSQASAILVADWRNIEEESGARLTQDEGFVIDRKNKTAQLQSDSLQFVDNTPEGGGVLISMNPKDGVVTNKLHPIKSPYQYIQNEHLSSNYYTKPEVDNLVERLYKIRGSVPDFASLPSSGNTLGDVYNLIDNGDNYVWADHKYDGTEYWDKLSGLYDLSSYATQLYVDEKLGDNEGGVWNFPV